MRIKKFWQILKATTGQWSDDKAPQQGAALAFYSILSIGPVILIAISIAGLVFGRQAASGQIVAEIQGLIGEQGAQAVQSMLANAQAPSSGIVAGLLGLATLLIGASGVFGQLQDSLNSIWKVPPKTGQTIWRLVKSRFLSFAMVLGIGFLMLISLLISAVLSAVSAFFSGMSADFAPVLEAINFVVTFGVASLLFALIFKVIPDTQVAWRDVRAGAVMTAILFTVGKLLIGLYLGRAAVSSTYGAAGSLVVLSLWVYYSAQILFFGAEFTQVYASRYGSQKAPANTAPAPPPDR